MKRWWLALCAPLVMAACGEENPLEVGEGLLPEDVVRTFEITLDPARYLVEDASYGEYTDIRDLQFSMVAHEFEQTLDSRALARFLVPGTLTLNDTAGVVQLDTMPALIGGTVAMIVDSLRSSTGPVRLALYRTTERWNATASWEHRTDSAGVRTPWSTPGGAPGVLVDTVTFETGGDTVRFRIDSVTVAEWRDTTNAARGAIVVAETPGSRLFATIPAFSVDMRSSYRPDTVFTLPGGTLTRALIYTPTLSAQSSQLRAGGTPAWRAVIRLRERLDTLSFACPGVPGCSFRLADVTINHAGLRLQPEQPPPGFSPEQAVTVAAYLMLPSPSVPIQRSPLSNLVGLRSAPRSSFLAPGAPVLEVPITDAIIAAAMDPATRGDGFLPTYLALVAGIDARTFGFPAFASMPALRLVVTTAQEMQLP